MATVASVSIDKNGNATTGEGDTLIGTVEEHVKDIAERLVTLGHDAIEAVKRAEQIVASHIVKPADEVAADATEVADQAAEVAPPAPKPAAKPADTTPSA